MKSSRYIIRYPHLSTRCQHSTGGSPALGTKLVSTYSRKPSGKINSLKRILLILSNSINAPAISGDIHLYIYLRTEWNSSLFIIESNWVYIISCELREEAIG